MVTENRGEEAGEVIFLFIFVFGERERESGWVGGWVEEEEAVCLRCWTVCMGRWVGGWVGEWLVYLFSVHGFGKGEQLFHVPCVPTHHVLNACVEWVGGWVGWIEEKQAV